jgi:predicted transcriptional regulator
MHDVGRASWQRFDCDAIEKRHLSTHGLTPAEYLAKWGLPKDYPMTSANYSAARSQMAKSLGLGQKGRQARKPSAAGTRRGAAPKG